MDLYMLLKLLAWLAFLPVMCTMALECPEDEYEMGGVRCCKGCLPGEGVKSVCSAENNTICRQCVEGVTYSPMTSFTEDCRECTKCSGSARVDRSCSLTQDALCGCPPNFYYDLEEEDCRVCDDCATGHGVIKACSAHENTRCHRCPNGTYADLQGLPECRPCSVCPPSQLVLVACNDMEDTVCSDTPANQSIHLMSEAEMSKSKGKNIPLYCSLLGAVILGLVLYVVISHMRRRAANKKNDAAQAMPLEEQEVLAAAPAPKQGSDSGVCVENGTTNGLSVVKIRDLPAWKRRNIETMLCDTPEGQSHWRLLATEMGYDSERIAEFESQSEQDPHPPCHFLLNDWSRNDGANVGALARLLRTLGRDDAIRALYAEHRDHHGASADGNNTREPLIV